MSKEIKIQRETLTSELYDEMLPLGQESWDECSEIKAETCAFHGKRGFVIKPDKEHYLHLEECESMVALTARGEEGTLVGFALCVLYMSPHHSPVLCGNVDTFYIKPGYRVCMRRFISTIESELYEAGVTVMGWPTSPSGKMYDILKLLGYSPDDVIMEKIISPVEEE